MPERNFPRYDIATPTTRGTMNRMYIFDLTLENPEEDLSKAQNACANCPIDFKYPAHVDTETRYARCTKINGQGAAQITLVGQLNLLNKSECRADKTIDKNNLIEEGH